MKRYLVIFLMLLAFICVQAKELQFDDQGNLIDHDLDKLYHITSKYSLVITCDVVTPGYEVVFREDWGWELAFGFGYKLLYSNFQKQFFYKAVGIGFVLGYSLDSHRPTYGIGFTLRRF